MKWTYLLALVFSPLAVLADCDFKRINDTSTIFRGTMLPESVYIKEGDYVYPTKGEGQGEVGSVCLNQGEGAWTFTMLFFEYINHANRVFVFLVMDPTCHVRGIYIPDSCEDGGNIRGSFLKGEDEELVIVVKDYNGSQSGEFWSSVPGYFKMAYGAGEYESEQGGNCRFVDTLEKEGRGLMSQLSGCKIAFPIDGKGGR